jgi:hypothetical protein
MTISLGSYANLLAWIGFEQTSLTCPRSWRNASKLHLHPAQRPKGLEQWSMFRIEDVVMNMDDSTNGHRLATRPSDERRTDKAPPVDAASDDGDIFALMPSSQQTIWPLI